MMLAPQGVQLGAWKVICRLVFLLFTLLHIKSAASSVTHGRGYIYPQPPKAFSARGASTHLYDLASSNAGFNYGLKLAPVTKFAYPLADNSLLDEDVYVADGRILKQYEVMENIPGDILPDNFLQMSPLLLESFLAKYGRISPSLIPGSQPPPILPPVARTNGAIALGSGALGYIRLANGGVYLGSGSLGYISGQERIREVIEARTQNVAPAGPFSFGPSPPRYDKF